MESIFLLLFLGFSRSHALRTQILPRAPHELRVGFRNDPRRSPHNCFFLSSNAASPARRRRKAVSRRFLLNLGDASETADIVGTNYQSKENTQDELLKAADQKELTVDVPHHNHHRRFPFFRYWDKYTWNSRSQFRSDEAKLPVNTNPPNASVKSGNVTKIPPTNAPDVFASSQNTSFTPGAGVEPTAKATKNATLPTSVDGSQRNRTVPMAELLLRNLYGKASELSANELAAAWNVSQFFPVSIPNMSFVALPVSVPVQVSNKSSIIATTAGKKPSDPLTIEDLERILLENGFVRPEANNSFSSSSTQLVIDPSPHANNIKGIGQPVSDRAQSERSSSQVAFPQPSVLSYTSLKWGVTAASFLSCTLLATSVHPSLWLVGGLVGSLYGFQTGKRLSLEGAAPSTFFPSFLLAFGKRIATWYLQVYDLFIITTFMYKTGQLSYSMWRRYAEVDQRFQIQDKIDAWNAVFVEGKESFDRWEKENEVGRKVLAMARTIWLVEERSWKKTSGLKRRRQRSRYRIIQILYDGAYLAGRLAANALRFLSGGGTSEELSEFLRGIRLDISAARLDSIGARAGAIVAALVTVNIAGALYAISPFFCISLATVMALVWPTWLSEFLERGRILVNEVRARGRGEEAGLSGPRKVDKRRYHYYVNRDGNRKYYRVAPKPFFGRQQDTKQQGFRFPWQQKPVEAKRSFLFGFHKPTPR